LTNKAELQRDNKLTCRERCCRWR